MNKILDVINSDEYKAIEIDINNFVRDKLCNYKVSITSKKTIHDPVWGSIDYQAWEMQLIDSPLFQRLRNVNQVGLAMFTYPAARHSRFEHSLGVVSAVKLMCNRITGNTNNGIEITEEVQNCIVLAALLHDIGHCFYSHLSEKIYGEIEVFCNLKKIINSKLELKPKPHEILSFIIVNSEAFRSFFFSKISYPNKEKYKDSLFVDVGSMIIGYPVTRDGIKRSFQTNIINGPLDADKLDYIRRDAYTAGLPLQYDIERLFTKLRIHKVCSENGIEEQILVIDINGVTAVEELTFCKIMLFSYIYYHQKVLISENIIQDYACSLWKLGILNKISDFLEYTDLDILSLSIKQNGRQPFPEYGNIDLNELADNIRYRNLPKRCFELSQANVKNKKTGFEGDEWESSCSKIIKSIRETNEQNLDKLASMLIKETRSLMEGNDTVNFRKMLDPYIEKSFDFMLEKRREFFEEIKKEYISENREVNFSTFDIHIIFPKLVDYGNMKEKVVLGLDRQSLLTVNDFVKLSDWADSFNSNKWRGYVFVSDKIDIRIAYRVASRLILGDSHELKNPQALLKGI